MNADGASARDIAVGSWEMKIAGTVIHMDTSQKEHSNSKKEQQFTNLIDSFSIEGLSFTDEETEELRQIAFEEKGDSDPS